MSRRAPRSAPPSVRITEPVAWVDPEQVKLPLWRKVLSSIELGLLVAILGVALTAAFGVGLLGLFFLMDWIVS